MLSLWSMFPSISLMLVAFNPGVNACTFNNDTNEAQKLMNEIQGKHNIYYVGAWLGYGFHEDGISSAIKISKYFDIKLPWIEK